VLLTYVYGWTYWTRPSGALTGIGELLIVVVAPAVLAMALWYFRQGTPGQIALSLGVVDEHTGEPISAGQGLIRAVAGVLSAIPLGLGLLWIAFDPKKQGWHDKLAGTVVLTGVEMPMRGRDQGRVMRRDRRPLPRDTDEDTVLPLPDADLEWTSAVALARSDGFGRIVAALLLTLAGIGALVYAGPLREVGPWAIAIAAVVFLAHAAGLAMGWRSSLFFGLALFTLLGLGSLGVGAWFFTRLPGAPGWEFVGYLFLGIVTWVVGAASCAVGVALWQGRGSFTGDGRGTRGALFATVVSLVALAWASQALLQFYRTCEKARPGARPPACTVLGAAFAAHLSSTARIDPITPVASSTLAAPATA
jgi:uncharacterized RDD family membrane protein YckC